jgi:hypothetical protein
MTMDVRPTGKLAGAVCAVMMAVRFIPETGVNQFHKYKYASDEDLLSALQPAMAEHGLALVPSGIDIRTVEHSPDRKGSPQWRTELVVTYDLLHISGESARVQAPGSGIDGEDKGAYKAMTGALKYALRHLFLVPTGDDAERQREEAAPKGRGKGKADRETDEQRAARQAKHHPSWQDDAPAFFVALREAVGDDYNDVADFCEAINRPRPTAMDGEQRRKLVAYLRSDSGKAKLASFRAETGGGA